jgi:quercetin dioxygenase-like cupin family protein
MKPYIEEKKDGYIIREFSQNTPSLEFVWHRDKEDRHIEVIDGEGWEMQFDNELPFELVKGDRIFITEGRIHRILKGTTDLKIRIN